MPRLSVTARWARGSVHSKCWPYTHMPLGKCSAISRHANSALVFVPHAYHPPLPSLPHPTHHSHDYTHAPTVTNSSALHVQLWYFRDHAQAPVVTQQKQPIGHNYTLTMTTRRQGPIDGNAIPSAVPTIDVPLDIVRLLMWPTPCYQQGHTVFHEHTLTQQQQPNLEDVTRKGCPAQSQDPNSLPPQTVVPTVCPRIHHPATRTLLDCELPLNALELWKAKPDHPWILQPGQYTSAVGSVACSTTTTSAT